MNPENTVAPTEPSKQRFKLDEGTKIIAAISTVVTVLLAVAGFFANQRLQALQQSVQSLSIKDKEMDLSKKAYDMSARLIVDYSAPLARSFALQYSTNDENKVKYKTAIMFPTTQIAGELNPLLEDWRHRRFLMTGEACKQEGLKARQIVLLKLRNVGNATAENLVLKARQAASRSGSVAVKWNVAQPDGSAVPYADLATRMNDWTDVEIPIGRLYGIDTREEERLSNQIVLASVSGSADLYGTVLFPVELTWTDSITKQPGSMRLDVSLLRNDLLGAEIGSVGSARKFC